MSRLQREAIGVTVDDALPPLPKAAALRRQQRRDGGYDMVPAYSVEEMKAFAHATIARAERAEAATPRMLQDDSRDLSKCLSSKPDAPLHAREAAAAIGRERAEVAQSAQIQRLTAERDALKLQAQGWAQEARTHRATVHEAYQVATGATGEPGDWNGAKPIIAAVEAAQRVPLTGWAWTDIEARVDEYLADYVFEGDDCSHSPGDDERLVIKDAIVGLLSDSGFVDALAKGER